MEYKSRFDKQGKVKDVIFRILEEHQEGIDAGEFVDQVKDETGVSRGMIYDLIRELSSKKVTIERNSSDRRKAIYKPNLQRIRTDRGSYRAMQYLQSLKNPVFNEITVPKGHYTVHISVFGEGGGFNLEKEQKSLEQILQLTRKNVESTNMGFFQTDSFNKVILFFMTERTK